MISEETAQSLAPLCFFFLHRLSLARCASRGYANVLGTIANWQVGLKQYEQADVSYHRVLERVDRLDRVDTEAKGRLKATVYHQLGIVAQEQRQWAQAEQYYQQALQICVEYQARYEQARTYGQLGLLAQEQQQWAQARDYLVRALEIFVEFKDTYSKDITLHNLALLWHESGDASLLGTVAEKVGATVSEVEEVLRKMVGEGEGGQSGQ